MIQKYQRNGILQVIVQLYWIVFLFSYEEKLIIINFPIVSNRILKKINLLFEERV